MGGVVRPWDGMVESGVCADGCRYQVHQGMSYYGQFLWAVWSPEDPVEPVRKGSSPDVRSAIHSARSGRAERRASSQNVHSG